MVGCFREISQFDTKNRKPISNLKISLFNLSICTLLTPLKNVVDHSSAEAVSRAMAITTCELIRLKILLEELGMKVALMTLLCDLQADIASI